MTSTSGAMKSTAARRPTFYLAYWLLCLDSHTFVLALSELLAWLLVERSPRIERLLSASPDTPYERCWSTFEGVWLPMKAPRYFLLLGSPSTKQDSRGLVFSRLPVGRTPCCRWLLWPCTPCYLWPRISNLFLALVEFYLLALSSRCPSSAETYGIHRVSST